MQNSTSTNKPTDRKVYIITGPTSGIGRATASDGWCEYPLRRFSHRRSLARGDPRLQVNAIEPGIMFNTGLHSHMNYFFYILAYYVAPLLAPFIRVLSTPKRAARVFTKILMDRSGQTGVYYDESGHSMQGSALLRKPKIQERIVAETRAFLAAARE